MDWQDFARKMSLMARDLLAQDSVDTTLGRISASATELIPGCDASGILVFRDGVVRTLAPTAQLVIDSDRMQKQLGEGPCFDAARHSKSERVYRIHDLTAEKQRWRSFAPRAQAMGVGSMMGFLLFTKDADFGALNFYSHAPGAFTDDSETAGLLLASHAAVALSAARTHAQMEQAVATRHEIGEAIGILMGSRGLTEDQAFDVLRRYSQLNNVKLREVARQLCAQGTLG